MNSGSEQNPVGSGASRCKGAEEGLQQEDFRESMQSHAGNTEAAGEALPGESWVTQPLPGCSGGEWAGRARQG